MLINNNISANRHKLKAQNINFVHALQVLPSIVCIFLRTRTVHDVNKLSLRPTAEGGIPDLLTGVASVMSGGAGAGFGRSLRLSLPASSSFFPRAEKCSPISAQKSFRNCWTSGFSFVAASTAWGLE